MIKAIETVYKGYRFRSRLEARWAVFFDALPRRQWDWRYESEGYQMHNTRYLPDFELVNRPWKNRHGETVQRSKFIEIKSRLITADDWNKIVRFSAYLEHDIYLIEGEIGLDAIITWVSPMYEDLPAHLVNTIAIPPFTCGSGDMTWAQCDFCGRADLWYANIDKRCYDCDAGHMQIDTDDLRHAVNVARSARFEHGETPRQNAR